MTDFKVWPPRFDYRFSGPIKTWGDNYPPPSCVIGVIEHTYLWEWGPLDQEEVENFLASVEK